MKASSLTTSDTVLARFIIRKAADIPGIGKLIKCTVKEFYTIMTIRLLTMVIGRMTGYGVTALSITNSLRA
jgi:hypothetical protein